MTEKAVIRVDGEFLVLDRYDAVGTKTELVRVFHPNCEFVFEVSPFGFSQVAYIPLGIPTCSRIISLKNEP